MARVVAAHKPPGDSLKIGFVPLVDAAPIIVAHEMGFFDDEGLHVQLQRQIGWGNVRDKLTFGELDASHALLGMSPLSALGKDQFIEPLVTILSLGTGGNAITLGKKLTEIGITTARALGDFLKRRQGRPLIFAHVFSCSAHHYLLRDWLAAASIDPDKDLQLCVLPPPQMVRQLARGLLDGFCVGEPWNVLAQREGLGTIVAATTQVVANHPEKVLVVSRRWLEKRGAVAEKLVRAVLRACLYCEDPRNVRALCDTLSSVRYLDTSAEILAQSLALSKGSDQPAFRSWATATLAPDPSQALWLLQRMVHWKHLSRTIDLKAIAQAATEAGPFHAAANSLRLFPTTKEPALHAVNL